MSTAIVGRCDRPKAFLTCSIPDLHLNHFAVQIDRANFLSRNYEINSDGRDEAFCISVILYKSYSKSQQKARLAHARIADQQQLEQIIAI